MGRQSVDEDEGANKGEDKEGDGEGEDKYGFLPGGHVGVFVWGTRSGGRGGGDCGWVTRKEDEEEQHAVLGVSHGEGDAGSRRT